MKLNFSGDTGSDTPQFQGRGGKLTLGACCGRLDPSAKTFTKQVKYSKCPTCGFATIYETNKPKSGIGERRIRPDQIIDRKYGRFKLSVYRSGRSTVYSFTKLPSELQGELL